MTTVTSIRSLAPEMASEHRPVELSGTVTALSGWKNSFFLADSTGGISIDRLTQAPLTAAGDRVTVHGHTEPGLFAPIVVADNVTVTGHQSLAEPKLLPAADLQGGVHDSERVAVRGIVRTAAIQTLWGHPRLVLTVDIGDSLLVTAVVQAFKPEDVHALTAAVVRLKGVCGTVFNDRRQYIGIRLFVTDLDDIAIERPAPREPFDLPNRPLNAMLQFRQGRDGVDMVKVTGTVTWSRAGEGLYLEDNEGGSLFVQSGLDRKVPLGTRVEAVGYPGKGTYAPQMENAIFQELGSAPPLRPLEVRASEMIVNRDGFQVAPHDSQLVKLSGKLREQFERGNEEVLLLQDGNTVFSARIPHSAMHREYSKGSTLSVTGVAMMIVDQSREPKAVVVMMRVPEDVVVVHGAPWWSAEHLSWLAGVLAVLAVLLFGIIAFLRRQAALREMVFTDQLTGLYNRRGFMAFAQAHWVKAQKLRTPLLLIYIDLDLFKQINDTHGHKMGDEALKRVGELLMSSFRKSDVIGRMGGDEFAAVALDGSPELAAELCDRIRSEVEATNAKHRYPFELSLSLGSVVCDPAKQGGSIEDLLAQADEIMYEQKRQRKAERAMAAAG
ncbi:GGDEF domain-containing protein [Granulicella cerasi]|uniref:diguanylate cyclase n=1 Tax=Granulicella cerasi TaxID=741063 RepID=A0ABW1ZAR7_9BACT|nr:GGDEF domain-containing protein [Granulicella cerasi]